MKRTAALAVILITAVPLMAAMLLLPPFASPRNPTYTHVVDRYLEKGPREAGAENVVTDVILNYRGYDTNGEVTVIFTAMMAVFAVMLAREGQEEDPPQDDAAPRSPVVRLVVAAIAPFTALFAVYVVLHGHLTPGGGFQGGTIFGALVVLMGLALGRRFGLAVFPRRLRPWLHPAAVLAFIAVGLLGLALFGSYLEFPSASALAWLRTAWLIAIEIGIGLGGAVIAATLFWTMESEPTVEPRP